MRNVTMDNCKISFNSFCGFTFPLTRCQKTTEHITWHFMRVRIDHSNDCVASKVKLVNTSRLDSFIKLSNVHQIKNYRALKLPIIVWSFMQKTKNIFFSHYRSAHSGLFFRSTNSPDAVLCEPFFQRSSRDEACHSDK